AHGVGHSPVTALAFSPDGSRIVVAGHGEVRILNANDGTGQASLPCGFPRISGFAFSPDGSYLAVSGGEPGVHGGVELFEWPGGASVGRRLHHLDHATAVAFHPSGTLLATAGADAEVHFQQWPGLTPLRILEGHSGPVLAARFSPDGDLLVTAGMDRSIKVWDAGTGELQRSFSHHTDIVHCLAFRPRLPGEGGSPPFHCASGSNDRTVRVWQPAIGRMIRIVRGHGGPILSVAYSADGSRLFSAGQEGIVRIIDADSDRILHEWRAHDDWIYATAVSPDGEVLVSGDWTGTVKLWDIREGRGTLLWTWPRSP
ncbi:MAG TPA: WD40 repeat domain-containing protein, partial [Methylomirabilota bacterium]|nr:WD40 repeat domain-containing protein [Methylomirabilota bacterium]